MVSVCPSLGIRVSISLIYFLQIGPYWAAASIYNINPLITGFSTCYIELALFNELYDFKDPPNIPVTVTFQDTLPQTHYENSSNETKRKICAEKKHYYFQTHNCLSIFLFSPKSDIQILKTVDRYSWIFSC